MTYLLRAATVVTPQVVHSPGWVAVRDGVISGAGAGLGGEYLDDGTGVASGERVEPARVIDLGDRLLAPGYFDVHVHGGDGAQVNGDLESDVSAGIARMARFHAAHGTTSMLATTVSDDPGRLATTVRAVAPLVGRRLEGGATVRGIHLEGPWIARAKLGAHDPMALRPPDPAELRSLAEASGNNVRILTVAPELRGADRLITEALDLGMRVAIGHTDADFETARAAIRAGASHATHLFNAMAPPHHRRPGAVTAVLIAEGVTLEVIADLEHVHPAMIELAARCAPGRLVAVSDAVPAAGLEPGTYQIGRMDVTVEGRRVSLAADPATLAGSILTMEKAVQNLVSAVGLPLEEAVQAATSRPAAVAGCDGNGLGSLRPGAPADIVVLSSDLGVEATIVAGEAVFDRVGLLAS